MLGPGAGEALRFASRVVGDPARAIGHWRGVTGGKAAACLPPIPVPEILHAAGLLPVQLRVPGIPPRFLSLIDAWVIEPDPHPLTAFAGGKPRFEFPTAPFADLPQALELVESLAAWAGDVSGRPATEGTLWKSIQAYGERNVLLQLLEDREASGEGFLPDRETGDLARAGDFLPPEAHSVLLARILRGERSGAFIPGEERGDPLLVLSRRLTAKDIPE